jgi:hypothetical protein
MAALGFKPVTFVGEYSSHRLPSIRFVFGRAFIVHSFGMKVNNLIPIYLLNLYEDENEHIHR